MSFSATSGTYTVAYYGDTSATVGDPNVTYAALAAQLQADPNGRAQYAANKAAEIAQISQGPDAGTPAGYQQLAKLREEMRYMQDHVALEDVVFQQSLGTNIADAGRIQRENLAARLVADPAAAQQYVTDKQAEIAALESQATLDPEGVNRHLDDLRDEMAYLQRQPGLAPDIQMGLNTQQTQAANAQTRILDAHLRADVPAQDAYTGGMRKDIDDAARDGATNPADAYGDLNRMFNQMSSLTPTADPALQALLQQLMAAAKTEADKIAIANPGAIGDVGTFTWGV